MARLSASNPDSPFYGFPAELIAHWCCVSLWTARAWKRGSRTPSPTALALFRLYASEKVLTEEFNGFIVRDGKLVPPNGRGFTPEQLVAYELVYMIAMTQARPEVEAHLQRMGLAKRETPPTIAAKETSAPRWVVDPFFNPREGTRTVVLQEDDRRI